MEYACIVWDPYQITYIIIVLKESKDKMGYIKLELHHKIARLSFFHKITYNPAQ